MSKQQDKKNLRIIEQAEYLWEKAQLQAATAQNNLGAAESVYNNMKHEMDKEEQLKTDEQLFLRKKDIKDFIEAEKALYLERLAQIKESE